ncbi:permease [bacterium]|nr:permease [bacterium]
MLTSPVDPRPPKGSSSATSSKIQQIKLANRLFRGLIYLAMIILAADWIYKTINNITYVNREKCILSRSLPKIGFLFYEYFIELILIVLVGIFISVLLEQFFGRYQRFYPRNPVTAFLYASLIPVCACGVLPLTVSMRDKLSFGTIITFIVAAPLLNPYIIVLSFSVLGVKYALMRIAAAFVLAISAGWVLNRFQGKAKTSSALPSMGCPGSQSKCHPASKNSYDKSYVLFKQIFPYLLLAGALGILTELYLPNSIEHSPWLRHPVLSVLSAIVVGIPVYLCNGADVLFLRPLLNCGGLTFGAGLTFSLTSTAVCVTSIIMLLKFIGRKLTAILLVHMIVVTLLLGLLINLIEYYL